MSLTLADALSHYRSVSETTHKFWGYFQAVAAGTAAFAWSRDSTSEVELFALLSMAFAVFAIGNWRLVVSSQAEAVIAEKCIKNYAHTLGPAVPNDLRPLIQQIKPDSTFLIGVGHAGLSIATIGAVWWQFFPLCR